jgi:hypothetical protein
LVQLRHLGTDQRRPLAARSLVGRSDACVLRLADAHVSGEHASLVWTPDGVWRLRDLGSRNGTWVDGERVVAGRAIELQAGARLAFGRPDELWALDDAGAPGPVAIDLATGEGRAGEDGLLVLPSEDAPELSVLETEAGWVTESEQGPTPCPNTSVLIAGGRSWRVHLPANQVGTPLLGGALTLESAHFVFAVSADEEHTVLRIRHRGAERALPPREHWYALLLLARAREADAARRPADRGWVRRESLLRQLRMDPSAFDVAIHRARKQLVAAGVRGGAGIVEVRRGERRLGTDRFTIERLED